MMAGRRRSETIAFPSGCGSGDESASQVSSHRPSRPMEWSSILRNSGSRGSAAIVLSGLLSWCHNQAIASVARSATPLGRFVPRARSSFADIVVRGDRRPRMRPSAAARLALPPQRWGRRGAVPQRRRLLMWTAVAVGNDRRGRRSRHERPSPRRTSKRAYGTAGGNAG